ncbi:hypothetical protein V8E55_007758 [Tylopilus felleus]
MQCALILYLLWVLRTCGSLPNGLSRFYFLDCRMSCSCRSQVVGVVQRFTVFVHSVAARNAQSAQRKLYISHWLPKVVVSTAL